MKILFFIFALLMLPSCVSQTSADKIGKDAAQPTPTVNNADVSNTKQWTPPPDEAVDNAKLGNLEKQNAPFKIVPEEFSKVNFENFNFPSSRERKIIPLKNGSYEYEYKGNGCIACGGEEYDLGNVYFVDLTGDKKKEAFVMLLVLFCGGSCDGGADLIYIYSANRNKPKLLWRLATGSKGYGCGIKSLAIESKKINIELFGKCKTEADIETSSIVLTKFHFKDSSRLIYEFDGKTFVRKHKEYISVPERNVMNYISEISISE